MRLRRVCIVPDLSRSTGGPASFYKNLVYGLRSRGVDVAKGFKDGIFDAVLVINGTSQLADLWRCKKQGIPVVQRLGGINWLHQYLPVGFRAYLLSELRNVNMRLIRSVIADRVVYQSRFVRDWWHRRHGKTRVDSTIIYNGVNLDRFNPQGPKYQSRADVCIISVEGTQGADPFDTAIQLAQKLAEKGLRVELLVFGNAWRDARSRLTHYPFVNFKGAAPNSDLPYFYRGAAFYISTDVIAACPNSVLEALGCGIPVLGYQTGALSELLDESAGRCVECDGGLFQGKPPGNLQGMVAAALELLSDCDHFHHAARKLAERRYGLGQMVAGYERILGA